MIVNKVYKLKKDVDVAKDMPLKAGQLIQIVNDVVYINGGVIQKELQGLFYSFVVKNLDLFIDIAVI